MASDEKVESSAEIISDIRERADTAERHGEHQTHNDGVAMLLRSIADRLEAAYRNERLAWQKSLADCKEMLEDAIASMNGARNCLEWAQNEEGGAK